MPLGYGLIRTLATCAAAWVSCVAAATAQPPESWTLCSSRDMRLADQAIDACSAIISSSDNDSGAAAAAHGYRGVALLRRSAATGPDRESGLGDLEAAVSSGMNTAMAYVFRCHLHLTKQNPDLAIADCDEAIRRDPQIALAFAVRGAASCGQAGP